MRSNEINFLAILSPLAKLDLPILMAIALLIFLGSITLYSASGENFDMVYRQGSYLFLATILMLVLTQIQSKTLAQLSVWFYLIVLFLLVLVLLEGHTGKGAKRWLDLGLFKFQPSEMMKLALPMMIARFFANKTLPVNLKDTIIAIIIIIVPMFLVIKQPDLGTSLLIGSAGFFVIYFAGLPWKFIFGAIIISIPAAYLSFKYLLHPYQVERVLTVLNPERDPSGAGYHIIQSKIALGSGGMYGKGWLNGDQSRLNFLPECHTDFIFAVFGEEFGLFGNLVLLTIYLFIIWRGLYLAVRGTDTFARLLGGSLSLTFFVYLFVNTGMVSGLLPVVGVPLPLVSYGGTSLVTLLAAFGILMGLKKRKRIFKSSRF